VTSNATSNVDTLVDASPANPLVVDWDALEIVQIQEDQVSSVVPMVEEDQLYTHIGLRVEDERE
jgi:hypothetical protein